MNFLQLAKARYSVRDYSQTPVEDEKIKVLLEAAKSAPTAANRQPQRILLIKSKDGRKKAAEAANTFSATLLMIICSNVDEVWTRKFDSKKTTDIDASIVSSHIMLAATDIGLGSCWIAAFDPEILRKNFNIPPNFEPINILALGYPAESSIANERHFSRKDFSETVFYENFE